MITRLSQLYKVKHTYYAYRMVLRFNPLMHDVPKWSDTL